MATPGKMKEHHLHILIALTDRDRYGTDIIRQVSDATNSRFRIWPPMLYRCLNEMKEDGLVTELEGPRNRQRTKSGRRRYFGITEKGLGVLSDECDRLAEFVTIARSRMRQVVITWR